jgi:hypothetical protein
MLAPRIEKAATSTNLMRLQRSLLRSSHALVHRTLPIRAFARDCESSASIHCRVGTVRCVAFGSGKAHERQIAICSSQASSMPSGDCLGSRSGVRRCMFSRGPHLNRLDRLKASCDVSSPAAGLSGLEASETCCRATCTFGTCMAEAGECSAVSHPRPDLLDMHNGVLVPTHARLPAV